MRSATSSRGRWAISFLAFCKLLKDLVYRRARRAKRERGEVGNRAAGKFYGEGFGTEPLAVANAAECGGHVLRHPLAVGVRSGLFEISLEEFQDAGKAKAFFGLGFFPCRILFHLRRRGRWMAGSHREACSVCARGIYRRAFRDRAVGVGAELQGALENRGGRARAEAAIKKRAAPIIDDPGRIEIILRTEAIASRASAIGRN